MMPVSPSAASAHYPALCLAELLGGLFDLSGLADDLLQRPVGELRVDSRLVQPGDTFIAVPGAAGDGRNFIAAAQAQGCALILTEAESVSSVEPEAGAQSVAVAESQGVPQLSLPRLAAQLSALGARFYGVLDGQGQPQDHMRYVGITGTNGKTSCAQWLTQLLELLGQQAASIGTLGYGRLGREQQTGFTTPDALGFQRILAELAGDGIERVVSEVSSHGLAQGRVAAVPFNLAVMTNIGRDHLDYHGNMKDYVEAKSRLMAYPSLQAAVVNIDDVYASKFIYALPEGARALSYSLTNAEADFYCADIAADARGLSFTLCSPAGRFAVQSSLWGQFNLYNLLAVSASAFALGHSMGAIASHLDALTSVPGRMQRVISCVDTGNECSTEHEPTVLVDFAHTPDALEAALGALAQHVEGRLWCVFGCGGDRDKGKRPLMAAAVEQYADRIVLTSDNPRSEDPVAIAAEVQAGFSAQASVLVELDRTRAIEAAVGQAAPGDAVLIAGKGHEQFQLVGAQRLAFSDVAVAQAALLSRRTAGGASL